MAVFKEKSVVDGVTYYGDTIIVNKSISLPADYAPGENAEARAALDKLMTAGTAEGLNFAIRSGFRSYDEQDVLYHNYVARDGKAAADTYSAEPGHSEHQTGLAFDLGSRESVKDFTISFGDTPEENGSRLMRRTTVSSYAIQKEKSILPVISMSLGISVIWVMIWRRMSIKAD